MVSDITAVKIMNAASESVILGLNMKSNDVLSRLNKMSFYCMTF